MKKILFVIALITTFFLFTLIKNKFEKNTSHGSNIGDSSFVTSPILNGDVISTISASGTIEPEELIDVGSQVSGQILEFGKDTNGNDVDYCTVVTNGMLLAKIDDITYVADLNVAEAQLRNAKASVAVAEANLISAGAKLKQAERDWERAKKIGVGDALSQSMFDAYEAAFETASADISVCKAAVQQAEASVIQAEASVEKAERNLAYCTILSPVDGIVIDRRVNKGQTIVSSMSASSLFLIATDLRKIQIWVAVNEADVGQLKTGTKASFSVDAFPGKVFYGVIKRVRLNATVTSNVVTYTVEVETDNPDGLLLPYLTANVQFVTESAENALVIPARALRWKPVSIKASLPDLNSDEGVVFIQDSNGLPRMIKVRIILSNGTEVAVESSELQAGMNVITGVQPNNGNANTNVRIQTIESQEDRGSKNPFMPNMPKPAKNRGAPPIG